MIHRWDDARHADVEAVLALAEQFTREAVDDELGEPWVTSHESDPLVAAAILGFCAIVTALFVAVLVIQAGRWLL